MTVTGKFPNQVNADPYGSSLVSGQNWDVIVTSLTSSGTPRVGSTIKVYDFDINTGASTLLGTGTTASNGQVNVNCSPVYNVQGEHANRLIRIWDNTAGEYTDYTIPVWFHVYMTLECYTSGLACGSATEYVALPSTTATCGQGVYVYTTSKGKLVSTTVEDRGPGDTTDAYWNGSGVPQWVNGSGYHVGMDGSAALWSALGFVNGTDYSCSGGFGTTSVYWRFT